ncbi:GDYXXLXY domain-containing protein [Falsibacillus albus]|nr:GDYXXLXY domain-containing protein [Falsibacillus albus]
MAQLRLIRTGYLMAISLLLAGISYFFASNWQGFDREEKVVFSVSIFIIFYLVSFIVSKLLERHLFLSRWTMVAGAVSFGISVGLIGQIYNSHADSYWLFLIWLLPALIFSIVTKYQPFYIMSFILANLAFAFYYDPQGYSIDWVPWKEFILLFSAAIVNLLLASFAAKGIFHSPVIKYMGLIIFHLYSLYLGIVHEFHGFGWFMNALYIVLLTLSFYYFLKVNPHKGLVFLTGTASAVFIVMKGLELMSEFYQEFFFFILLGAAVLLVAGSVWLLKYISSHPMNRVLRNMIIMSVTFIATIFAVAAIFGITTLIFSDINFAIWFFLSLIILAAPSLYFKWTPPIRYTMLSTGYAIMFLSSSFNDKVFYQVFLLAVLILGMWRVSSIGMRVFHYLLINAEAFILLNQWTHEFRWIGLIIFVLNLSCYFLRKMEKQIRWTAIVLGLSNFLGLTMLENIPSALYFLYNIGFFVLMIVIIYISKRNKMHIEWCIGWIFWFIFLANKYYDLAWNLFNKSLSLLIMGIIFLAFSIYFDRKYPEKVREGVSFVQKKGLPILVVVLLQIGLISYQAASNENLLRSGSYIRLSIEPMELRSFMQGDYLHINYNINTIPELQNKLQAKRKIQVVLRKDLDGYWKYAGYYQHDGNWNKPYEKEAGDVIINGTYVGWENIEYGIEKYFLADDIQRVFSNGANTAYVRVSENGNAIIYKLTKE